MVALGGSVAVPGGVPGSTTLTAILETKDARIQTLEKEVGLLEAELQRIRESGGRLREQLLRATAVPSGGSLTPGPGMTTTGIEGNVTKGRSLSLPSTFGGTNAPPSSVLTRGPSSLVSALLPPGQSTTTAQLTNALLAGSTGTTGGSCLAGISSGMTTGVVNPYTDRHQPSHHQHQHQHHHHHHPQTPYQQHQSQQAHQAHQQTMQQHLKQIEPAAAGALALHAHTFNKHDLNFKRQVSFFINNVRIEKNDVI
uniref:Uncharacterized protein n=1 Tax=Bracon brevicornis TaxID=1563983 RepID=A0A6V7M9I5_9HYME